MSNNNIAYLLKFAPKEVYIDDLLNGRLYMNAAGYYQACLVKRATRSKRP